MLMWVIIPLSVGVIVTWLALMPLIILVVEVGQVEGLVGLAGLGCNLLIMEQLVQVVWLDRGVILLISSKVLTQINLMPAATNS